MLRVIELNRVSPIYDLFLFERVGPMLRVIELNRVSPIYDLFLFERVGPLLRVIDLNPVSPISDPLLLPFLLFFSSRRSLTVGGTPTTSTTSVGSTLYYRKGALVLVLFRKSGLFACILKESERV